MKKRQKENQIDEFDSNLDGCEDEKCSCHEGCECGDDCTCDDECRCGEDCECHKCEDEKCSCHEGCECGDNCTCDDECSCGEDCQCHKHDKSQNSDCCCNHDCECDDCDCDECDCDECEGDDNCLKDDCHCNHQENGKQNNYLLMAQRMQADFDNYRKRVAEQLDLQREEGKKSVIEVFLPCLDTFKEAKKSISDESVLAGVSMIEEKILNALKTLKVEKIETIGKKFDHNLHEVVAVYCDENQEDDIILDEFQAGYKLNGKVIKYSKVIVNKKGE